ncbi:semaphorin-1A-like isoform X1 [Rhopilema esculentum]|uniref:semaphorin-1A-like isoform X1 n=1 Tax=Rhopilema esculentum TaxID=499914 RepID=UPI0031D995D7
MGRSCLYIMLLIILYMSENNAEIGSALHSVPSTSSSIRRFPEPGSEYAKFLTDFKSVELNPNKTDILVAAKEYLFRLDIETFKIQNTSVSENVLHMPVEKRSYDRCIANRIEKNDCPNYMLFAIYNTSSDIFACGTYSLLRRCWLVSSRTFKVTKQVNGEFDATNEFTPNLPSGSIIGTTTDNGGIFGAIAVREKKRSSLRAILSDDTRMKSGKPTIQFNDPHFVYSYAADDGFVYFFFSETADEVSDRQMVYSRVGRVCSYDKGSFLTDNAFISFSKSQIICYEKGAVRDYYDHIQSATAVTVHDKAGKAEVFIYASFTTTMRATGSSAVCRYKFKDIQNLFQTSQYYVKKTDGGTVKYEPQNHPDSKFDVSRMKCDESLNTVSITSPNSVWITSNPLLYSDNEPFDRNTVTTFSERVTSITVEDVHREENKTDPGKHILFAGTDSGKIFKVVMNITNIGKPVVLEEIQAVDGRGAITSLHLTEKYVIASGKDINLIRVDKERCESKYLMCRDCLKARDPFCAWSISQKKCTRTADLAPSDRIQDVERGSDKKCPPVDVNISCSLTIVDNIPGAWTALQCTGHGKIAPKVLAWKKDQARLHVDQSIYEIRQINASSQQLIIKGYTAKELGTYGCVVGLEKNKSECSIPIKGEKAEAKCVSNSTNCSCAVTGYPLPSMRKLINGNQTVKISQYGPIIIDPGVTLFAFNAFGDDVFTCPVVTLPTMITTTTTTSPSTTKTSTTTTTTTSPTTLSTTKTTTFSKSTRANTSLAVTTTKPTTLPTTIKTNKTPTTRRKTVTKEERTMTTAKTTTGRQSSTQAKPATPGRRGATRADNSNKYLAPFLVFLCLFLILLFANLLFFCRHITKRRERDTDEEDEFDGKKGTLNISMENDSKKPHSAFYKPSRLKKTDSTKPLMKKERSKPSNGSTPNHTDTTKLATEMDERGSSESGRYITHIKT